MYYDYYGEPYLSHHGIKGQKWGVRRFQNEDGSYTNLGEQHRYKTPSMRDVRKAYKSAVKRNNMQLGKDFDSAGDDSKAVSDASMKYDKQRYLNKANYHADRARVYDARGQRALTNIGRDKNANKATRELIKSDISRAKANNDREAIAAGKKALSSLNMQTMLLGQRGSGAYNRYRDSGDSAVKAYFRNYTTGSFS